MCQLTLVRSNNLEINNLFLISQLLRNSESGEHGDGFGIFSEKGIYKRGINPNNLYYLRSVFNRLQSLTIGGHVRKASAINKDTVDDEHAHPFEYKKLLILAHNGTLELKKTEAFPGKIDSQIFLEFLGKEYEKDHNLISALTNAYANFTGKFAFIIYEHLVNKWTIAVGETATIHKVDLKIDKKIIGVALNTEKRALELNYNQFINLINVTEGIRLDYNIPITRLDSNSIYELNGFELIKVGELKEEKSKVIPVVTTHYLDKPEVLTYAALIPKVRVLLEKYGITFEYWDYCIYALYEKPISSLFYFELTKIIDNFHLDSLKIKKSSRRFFNRLKRFYGSDLNTINKLEQFPWWMNPPEYLEKKVDELKLDDKDDDDEDDKNDYTIVE